MNMYKPLVICSVFIFLSFIAHPALAYNTSHYFRSDQAQTGQSGNTDNTIQEPQDETTIDSESSRNDDELQVEPSGQTNVATKSDSTTPDTKVALADSLMRKNKTSKHIIKTVTTVTEETVQTKQFSRLITLPQAGINPTYGGIGLGGFASIVAGLAAYTMKRKTALKALLG